MATPLGMLLTKDSTEKEIKNSFWAKKSKVHVTERVVMPEFLIPIEFIQRSRVEGTKAREI